VGLGGLPGSSWEGLKPAGPNDSIGPALPNI